jgi:predicted nucleic acid-binding protein
MKGKGSRGFGSSNCDEHLAPIVLVDSCVWHRSFTRNVFRHLAIEGAIRIRWSRTIEMEWIESVLRARPEIARSKLLAVRDRFRTEFPDGLVPDLLPRLKLPPLPDPNDAHVLVAAISARASVICTLDRRGFPSRTLHPLRLSTMSPKELLAECVLNRLPTTARALQDHRANLTNPPYSIDAYLEALHRADLVTETIHTTKLGAALLVKPP